MLSKRGIGNRIGEDSSDGKLLLEIEALSRALYLDKTLSKTITSSVNNNRSKSTGKTRLKEPKINPSRGGNEDSLPKNKKSIWSWKALKALTHVRNHEYKCCFTLHVHSISGLPPNFENISLCVHWRRRDGGLVTRPARVFRGVAEFEEQLTHKCSVYGTSNGTHRPAKYDAKQFLLYAEVFGAPELELGRHRFDLTRFLPLTLEELETEKSTGKWTTSFKLSGKAKGATLNVSFGYLVMKNSSTRQGAIRDSIRLSIVKPKPPMKDLLEILPPPKLDEEKADKPKLSGYNAVNEFDDGEFSVTECGVELCTKEKLKSEDGIFLLPRNLEISKVNGLTEVAIEGNDSNSVQNMAVKEFDSRDDVEEKLDYKQRRRRRSLSLDSFADSVARDFLDMLEREFENDFDHETQNSPLNTLPPEDFSFPSVVIDQDSPQKPIFGTNNVTGRKIRALMLEDMETEDLMHRFGLNELVFQSPIDHGSLGKGLGPILKTKNGGFLRTMSSTLFGKPNLIMQVSSPIVVPAEMGNGLMEILKSLASLGIENLTIFVNKMMPLEDISGKTMEQIAWEVTTPSLEASERRVSCVGLSASCGNKIVKGKSFGPRSIKFGSNEYVALEDLTRLAMKKIEALSIEGLKIQSDMAEEDDTSSNINPQFIGKFSAFKGIEDDGHNNIDRLMGLSLSLEEWTSLDSGKINEEELINARTIKILAAHGKLEGKMKCTNNGENTKCGLFGNKFTLAMMVQLRDPYQNNEPVGTPMLGLVQVERVFMAEKKTEESKMMFKIDEVYVAGVRRTELGKMNNLLWGCRTQQESSFRWLVANGVGKSDKHPFSKSRISASATTMADALWSISARGDNPSTRNPNVIFPKETNRLH